MPSYSNNMSNHTLTRYHKKTTYLLDEVDCKMSKPIIVWYTLKNLSKKHDIICQVMYKEK